MARRPTPSGENLCGGDAQPLRDSERRTILNAKGLSLKFLDVSPSFWDKSLYTLQESAPSLALHAMPIFIALLR
ncbi:MAG: hypothetical protein WAN92_08015 [Herbaspirillum sp.]